MNSIKLFIAVIALVGSQLVHAGTLPCGARTDDGPRKQAETRSVLPALRTVATKAFSKIPAASHRKAATVKGKE